MLPSPYLTSVVTCGRLLAAVDSSPRYGEQLQNVIQGNLIVSLAVDEEDSDVSVEGISTEIYPKDDWYRLRGTKAFVPYAESANMLICVARHVESGDVMLVQVQPRSRDVVIEPMDSIAGYPQARVEFRDVGLVHHDQFMGRLGEGGGVLAKALEWATLVRCGEMVGRGRRILEMVIDYAKTRAQFGRPIGAFQAIQHQLADLRVAVDAAELLAYRAACSMGEGEDCAEEIALAKASADEMSRMSTVVGHGVYAGISYTVEHDMQLYSARNRLAEAESGGTLGQIDRIAGMMGL